MWEMVEGYQTAGAFMVEPGTGLLRFTAPVKQTESKLSTIEPRRFTNLIEQEMAKVSYSEMAPSSDPADFPNVSEKDAAKIDETAKQMESLVLYQLLKQMWNTIPEGSLFASGPAEQMYREMWIEQMAGSAVKQGSVLGIADMVERELLDKANRTVSIEELMPELLERKSDEPPVQEPEANDYHSLRQQLLNDRIRNANPYGYLSGSSASLD